MVEVRETEEIQAAMIADKEQRAELNGLTSTSDSALWRLIMFVCAAAINQFEQLKAAYLLEVETAARKAISGTDSWWHSEVLRFQFDPNLTVQQTVQEVTPGVVEYPVINESLRVVTRAAIKEQSSRRLLIKAATGDDVLTKLPEIQRVALLDYAKSIGPVGIPVEVRSVDPDECKVSLNVYYNGQQSAADVKGFVVIAIENYFKSLSVDRVDGVIFLNKLIDAIQSVEGVIDTDTQNMIVSIREGAKALGDDDQQITRTYETFAGYVIGETTAGNTLNDTITMIVG